MLRLRYYHASLLHMVCLTRQQQQSLLVTSKPLSSVLPYDYLEDVSGTQQYRIDRNLHVSLISISEQNKLMMCNF
jgi:hypothetical protein